MNNLQNFMSSNPDSAKADMLEGTVVAERDSLSNWIPHLATSRNGLAERSYSASMLVAMARDCC
jgi:hypothetical protein